MAWVSSFYHQDTVRIKLEFEEKRPILVLGREKPANIKCMAAGLFSKFVK